MNRDKNYSRTYSYNRPFKPLMPKPHYTNPPKESNQLFAKNLPFEMSTDQIQKMFEEFGELQSFKRRANDPGMAFITYYDIRNATKALNDLNKKEVSTFVDTSFLLEPLDGIEPPTY